MASGIKLVENRPRSMIRREDFNKPFALHASREIDESVYDRIFEIAPELPGRTPAEWGCRWYRLSRVTSAVIGVATIVGRVVDRRCGALGVDDDGHCRRCGLMPVEDEGADCPAGFFDPTDIAVADLGDQRRWFFGRVGYVLRDVRWLLEPVPCRGWQGFWSLSADVKARVIAQLDSL